MNSSEAVRWPRSRAIEDANALLNPMAEPCPPSDRSNALLVANSRCRCARCYLNRTIRRGLLSAPSGRPGKISNLRLSPTALVEVAGLLQTGMYILTVSVVLAGPLVAMEASPPKAAPAITVAFSPLVTPTSTPATVLHQQNSTSPQTTIPQRSPRTRVTVPETLESVLAPPQNLRIISIQ
jgi:hypothetical protein